MPQNDKGAPGADETKSKEGDAPKAKKSARFSDVEGGAEKTEFIKIKPGDELDFKGKKNKPKPNKSTAMGNEFANEKASKRGKESEQHATEILTGKAPAPAEGGLSQESLQKAESFLESADIKDLPENLREYMSFADSENTKYDDDNIVEEGRENRAVTITNDQKGGYIVDIAVNIAGGHKINLNASEMEELMSRAKKEGPKAGEAEPEKTEKTEKKDKKEEGGLLNTLTGGALDAVKSVTSDVIEVKHESSGPEAAEPKGNITSAALKALDDIQGDMKGKNKGEIDAIREKLKGIDGDPNLNGKEKIEQTTNYLNNESALGNRIASSVMLRANIEPIAPQQGPEAAEPNAAARTPAASSPTQAPETVALPGINPVAALKSLDSMQSDMKGKNSDQIDVVRKALEKISDDPKLDDQTKAQQTANYLNKESTLGNTIATGVIGRTKPEPSAEQQPPKPPAREPETPTTPPPVPSRDLPGTEATAGKATPATPAAAAPAAATPAAATPAAATPAAATPAAATPAAATPAAATPAAATPAAATPAAATPAAATPAAATPAAATPAAATPAAATPAAATPAAATPAAATPAAATPAAATPPTPTAAPQGGGDMDIGKMASMVGGLGGGQGKTAPGAAAPQGGGDMDIGKMASMVGGLGGGQGKTAPGAAAPQGGGDMDIGKMASMVGGLGGGQGKTAPGAAAPQGGGDMDMGKMASMVGGMASKGQGGPEAAAPQGGGEMDMGKMASMVGGMASKGQGGPEAAAPQGGGEMDMGKMASMVGGMASKGQGGPEAAAPQGGGEMDMGKMASMVGGMASKGQGGPEAAAPQGGGEMDMGKMASMVGGMASKGQGGPEAAAPQGGGDMDMGKMASMVGGMSGGEGNQAGGLGQALGGMGGGAGGGDMAGLAGGGMDAGPSFVGMETLKEGSQALYDVNKLVNKTMELQNAVKAAGGDPDNAEWRNDPNIANNPAVAQLQNEVNQLRGAAIKSVGKTAAIGAAEAAGAAFGDEAGMTGKTVNQFLGMAEQTGITDQVVGAVNDQCGPMVDDIVVKQLAQMKRDLPPEAQHGLDAAAATGVAVKEGVGGNVAGAVNYGAEAADSGMQLASGEGPAYAQEVQPPVQPATPTAPADAAPATPAAATPAAVTPAAATPAAATPAAATPAAATPAAATPAAETPADAAPADAAPAATVVAPAVPAAAAPADAAPAEVDAETKAEVGPRVKAAIRDPETMDAAKKGLTETVAGMSNQSGNGAEDFGKFMVESFQAAVQSLFSVVGPKIELSLGGLIPGFGKKEEGPKQEGKNEGKTQEAEATFGAQLQTPGLGVSAKVDSALSAEISAPAPVAGVVDEVENLFTQEAKPAAKLEVGEPEEEQKLKAEEAGDLDGVPDAPGPDAPGPDAPEAPKGGDDDKTLVEAVTESANAAVSLESGEASASFEIPGLLSIGATSGEAKPEKDDKKEVVEDVEEDVEEDVDSILEGGTLAALFARMGDVTGKLEAGAPKALPPDAALTSGNVGMTVASDAKMDEVKNEGKPTMVKPDAAASTEQKADDKRDKKFT